MALWDHLEKLATLHPRDTCLVAFRDETVVTYGDLWAQILFTQSELYSLEARRVLAIVPNCNEAAILYLASMISGVDLCILGDSFAEQELNRAVRAFAPDLLVFMNPGSVTLSQDLLGGLSVLSLESLTEGWPDSCGAVAERSREFRSGRQIVATSGSTGEPKMLVLSATKLWESAQVFVNLYKLNSGNAFWNFLPMSYLGGTFNLLLIPLAAGGKILMDQTFGAGTFLRFFSTINRFEVNTLWIIPTILRGIRRLIGDGGGKWLSATQKISFIGTAPSMPEERRWLEKVLKCEVYENYGLTETTFLLAEPLRTPESNADYGMQPFPGVELEDSETRKTLRVKTPFLFDGYLRGAELESPLENCEWFDTKDVIETRQVGFSFTRREREIVKKGGVLINLAEVESLFRPLVGWAEVAAIPVEDHFYGENYVLLYESPDQDPGESAIIASLSQHVSKMKMPSDVRSIPRLPRTRSGKVDKPSALALFRGSLPVENGPDGEL